MYKNYIDLENFNHKLVIIFLDDGKMVSPMSFLSLGSGKKVLYCGEWIMRSLWEFDIRTGAPNNRQAEFAQKSATAFPSCLCSEK
jgi:hypothetical protein